MKAGTTLLAAALLAAAPLRAATEFEDSIPVELVEIFLGGGSQTRLYSDLPDDFPLEQAPAGFTLLGSVEQPSSTSVHLRTSLEEEQAVEVLGGLLEADGWLALPSPVRPAPEGGFASPVGVVYPRQWCHDAQGTLQIASRPADAGRLVTLRRFGGARVPIVQPSCREQLEQRRQGSAAFERPPRGGPLAPYLPRLVLPAEAELDGRNPGRTGTLSSSGDRIETETEMSIDWDIQRVYNHFAAMLGEQGWAPQDDWLSPSVAGGTWTRGADDALLFGNFTVLQTTPGDYVLQFRLFSRRPEQPEGGNGP